jgi:hypothetical protein
MRGGPADGRIFMRQFAAFAGAVSAAAAAILLASAAAPAMAQPPGGSYERSCRNIDGSNGLLTAECMDGRGQPHTSTIAYRRCHGDIGNADGILVCSGARGTEVEPRDYGRSGWGDRNDDGDYAALGRGYDGDAPDYGEPRGYDGGQVPYAQFDGLERHIRDQIRGAARDGMIAPDDARDLIDRLREIEDRRQSEYRTYGQNLPPDDAREIGADLQRLDRLVDETIRDGR